MKIKQVHFLKLFHKICSLLANFSLFLHIFLPYLYAVPAFAQDASPIPTPTPTSIVENTPTPVADPTIAPTETPAEPTVEPTTIPTVEPTVEPTAIPTVEPIITPTTTPIITDTPTSTPSENNNQSSGDNSSPAAPTTIPDSSPVVPTPSFMVPSPTPTPRVVEQVCLVTGDTIRDSVELDWNYDCATDTYVTREKVKLGVKYIFPKENNVTVTFTSLPKDELYRSYLKIKQVKTSDLKLPENVGNVGEYAYDITTDMFDGEFKYDITLPKNPDQTAEISYIEKTLDQAKTGVAANEINSVDESKVEQQDNKVVVTNIDHFTIFLVTANSTVSNTSVGTPDNGWVSDNVYATFDNKDDYAEYGFPVISNPSTIATGSVINGIEVLVEGKTNDKKDFEVSIWNASSNSYTSSQKANMSTSDSTQTLGGSTNLWGKSWTVADFSDANFKIKVDVNNDAGIAYLDHVEVKIYATDPITITPNPSLPQACGLDIALVLDVSGSIDSTELNQMKTAFKGFVDALAGTPTQFSVTKFDTTASVLQTFTGDSALVKTKIDSAFGGNYTNWQDGFVKTNSTLPNRSNPNLVIFASDGNPNRTGISGTSVNETIAVADAVTVANTIKSGGTRILALGIGSDLDIANMKAISGNSADTGNVLTSDVISTNFSTLATQLATFATQTCGGTLTIQKAITGLSSPTLSGWHFTVNGQDYSTDSEGKTSAIPLSAGTYSVTENLTSGYNLSGAVCTGATNNGTFDGTNKKVNGIQISNTNIVSCTFTNAYIPYCGDHIKNGTDECDGTDGVTSGYTCTGDCKLQLLPYCGDGTVNGNEQCEGNSSTSCTIPTNGYIGTKSCNPGSCLWNSCVPTESCGDGIKNGSETCDEGSAINGTYGHCKADCSGLGDRCGDSIKNGSEQCDDGNTVNTDICTNSCTNAVCGDSIVGPGEQCDDGNTVNNDTCTNSCTIPKCGDGILNQISEECDDGNQINTDSCLNTCKSAKCGDSFVSPTEECDDGNTVNTDACLNTCKAPTCGDGYLWPANEQCDNGYLNTDVACVASYNGTCNYCDTTCTDHTITGPYCGNNIIDGNEACDGVNLGGLSSTDFRCNGCSLELIKSTIDICHSTGAQNNPYVVNHPSKSGDVSGHSSDTGPIWYPGITITWGDIIPPFAYIGGTFPGLNWTTEGKSIYDNGCDLPKGTLIVKKVLTNYNGGTKIYSDFSFNIGGTSYTFENDGQNDLSVTPGKYTITENTAVGYTTTYNNCSDVTVPISGSATCTITNNDIAPKLNVVKKIIPSDNSGKFNLYIGSVEYAHNIGNNAQTNFQPVTAGIVNFSEAAHSGTNLSDYTVSYSAGCENGQTTLSIGETKTCTITNTRKTGSIVIVKNADPKSEDNFRFDVSSNFPGGDFELEDDGNDNNGGTEKSKSVTVNTGQYTVREIGESGWKLTNLVCNDQNSTTNLNEKSATINVESGETVTCTYTNKKLGSITINKDAIPNNSQDFRFTGTLGNFTLDDDNNNDYSNTKSFPNLLPGIYTINETPVNGWQQGDISCTGASVETHTGQAIITLGYNSNAVCTFHNIKNGSISGFKWNDENGDGQRNKNHCDWWNRGCRENYIESGLSNWTIFIDEGQEPNGILDQGEKSVITDNNGNYTLSGLTEGTYRVCEIEKTADGWHNTSGKTCQNITLITGEDKSNINFGNRRLGSIKVCKVIIDGSGKIVNGSEVPGSNFTIDWDKGLNDTVFSSGYTPESIIFNSSEGNDAICTTYNDLPIAAYHYSQETISNSDIWETPKYNDQYDESINDISDFYLYGQNADSNGEIDLRNNAGINRTLVILNQYKFGKINVIKYNDINGDGKYDDGTEEIMPGWTINLSGKDPKVTDDKGVIFDQLTPNTYTLSETMQPGWTQTGITCFSDSTPTSTPTETPTCIADGNICIGNNTSNGCCSGECNDGRCMVRTTPTPGKVWCHNWWGSGGLQCQEEELNSCEDRKNWDEGKCPTGLNLVKPVNAQVDSDSYNHKLVTVNPGDNINCYIGNQRLNPQLTISKSNDVIGDRTPGSSVGFKITVKVLNNDIDNLVVTDLPSNGFVYHPGSFKVVNLTTNETIGITEPIYHSPGKWIIGDVKAGDVLDLTYQADISSEQQPGVYKDLAYARGVADYDNSVPVIATSEVTGYVNNNLVGTDVPIVKETQNSVSAGVEKEVEGQVLGASTELPSTGSSTIWLLISALMTLIGLAFIKKSSMKIITIIFLVLFGLFSPKNISALDSLSVRLEQPKSPTNLNDLKLTFVALDLNNNAITVKCFKKGPSDGSYNQFGADIHLDAPGNTDKCETNSSILNTEGTYNFYVTANDEQSNIVSLDYKTSGPGTPSDYRKEWLNNGCDYKIHFKTADDGGKTDKVEIYRADITNFILDNGSRVASINIDSNQESTITNTVPDCSKSYYYVLRAFDDAGNGSGTIGDTVTITKTSTTIGTTTTTTGAIPVTNATLAPEEDQNALLTGTPSPEELATGNEEGTVLGTTVNTVKSFLQKSWLPLALGLIGLFAIIRYALRKKKKSSY